MRWSGRQVVYCHSRKRTILQTSELGIIRPERLRKLAHRPSATANFQGLEHGPSSVPRGHRELGDCPRSTSSRNRRSTLCPSSTPFSAPYVLVGPITLVGDLSESLATFAVIGAG